jgi:hypothetical protein
VRRINQLFNFLTPPFLSRKGGVHFQYCLKRHQLAEVATLQLTPFHFNNDTNTLVGAWQCHALYSVYLHRRLVLIFAKSDYG